MVPQALWPNFRVTHFLECPRSHQQRDLRFGGTTPDANGELRP
ncbi:hypothetical protein [Streptomyces sp. NPDC018034]